MKVEFIPGSDINAITGKGTLEVHGYFQKREHINCGVFRTLSNI